MVGDDLVAFVDGELFPYLGSFRQTATGPRTIVSNMVSREEGAAVSAIELLGHFILLGL